MKKIITFHKKCEGTFCHLTKESVNVLNLFEPACEKAQSSPTAEMIVITVFTL